LPYSKVPKQLPEVLTKEEVKRIFEAIQNKKHLLMIKLMYSAGLRVSELVHLKLKDLQLDNNFGWVRQGKGNKDRLFVIAKKLKPELNKHVAEEQLWEESWLFSGRNGNITVRSIQQIIKNAMSKAGIKKNVHPHTLRHSFATHLIENGYSVADVQPLMGHNSPNTTMTYVHMASPKMVNVESPYDDL
jgi:site-specific recombinase XerD